MATLLLSAAGSALGGALGGGFAGIGSAVLGKALGATLGASIDQRLLGSGSEPVETGRVDRFRVMGSSEGTPLPRAFGRVRLPGQLIWSSRFLETVNEEEVGGGKGGGSATVREYSYSVSIAVALCEGSILRVGRIWADGLVVDQSTMSFRVHTGSESQVPDPLIAAIEGGKVAPAYRGTAYVVFENLDLTPFGNRIPQFNFEVFRRPDEMPDIVPRSPWLDVRGVALVPGTGEYALATEPVHYRRGDGENPVLNVHNDRGIPDIEASLDQLKAELPAVESVSLVVSWFGDDLRCNRCNLQPAVEQQVEDGDTMPWRVSGLGRRDAKLVSRKDGRPVFGGTPCDASVLQAIRRLKSLGLSGVFYPFILMDVPPGNGLLDPWSANGNQPAFPWRGRITLEKAPGRSDSADKSSLAAAEVGAFFGSASPADFSASAEAVVYSGPDEWSYRRFILHYAQLCKIAGGVSAFCIGSEMRSLTHVRDGAAGYPAVRHLRQLAEDVRSILGPDVKIGYAADWSEYFGHHPSDGSGDVVFHLDSLWAHDDIDFIGIDNYMPLSDWQDGADHADAAAGSIYDLDYLTGNVASGEGYDWYYADEAGRLAQERLPITDGSYGEPWVFRYKDLVSWWSKPHHNRLSGSRVSSQTDWVPQSKPIWFTELGCPAVNKGTNQPNVFYDPKSSESYFPYHSNGSQDNFIQYRYLQAMFAHWDDPANNPQSDRYSGRMVDMSRAHVWAWDARPWPDFPDRLEVWSDGVNHDRGHWLNGRTSIAALAQVVAEICARASLKEIEIERLHGALIGYSIGTVESGRQSVQPLMLSYGFDGFSIEGTLSFASRGGAAVSKIDPDWCIAPAGDAVVSRTRSPKAEAVGRVAVGFVRSDVDYQAGAMEARVPDVPEPRTESVEVPIVLSDAEARAVARRSLAEAAIARDTLRLSLPLSRLDLTPGDIIRLNGGGLFRLDQIEDRGQREVSGVRIEQGVYDAPVIPERNSRRAAVIAPSPIEFILLDLPLLSGEEQPHSPHVAALGQPWTGPVAIYSANQDNGYRFDRTVKGCATAGALLDVLPAGRPGIWMPCSIRIRLGTGVLETRTAEEVLGGANVAALRDGTEGDWEVIQFERAELVSSREYRLTNILRGQAGTDGTAPKIWPSGTRFVLLNGAVGQLSIGARELNVERHYRVGPAAHPFTHASYTHLMQSVAGVGLRPYRPAHLAAARRSDGTIVFSWIRRSRIDGDSWSGAEIPLGEEREEYLVRLSTGANILREAIIDAPMWTYAPADQTADTAAPPRRFEVAQVSARFGAGPFEGIEINV
jgi:GTA TIM-barrel-like domain/Putative phage tail protein